MGTNGYRQKHSKEELRRQSRSTIGPGHKSSNSSSDDKERAPLLHKSVHHLLSAAAAYEKAQHPNHQTMPNGRMANDQGPMFNAPPHRSPKVGRMSSV